MTDYIPYYPIHSAEDVQLFAERYIPLVLLVANQLKINLNASGVMGDHFGLQTMSGDEFDRCDTALTQIADMIHDKIIHNRRIRAYRFKTVPTTNNIAIPKIEMFEPKPDADISTLRPGIEHIAFSVDNYDSFLSDCKQKGMPIKKEGEINGSRFFKTVVVNSIEIEFRNDRLGE